MGGINREAILPTKISLVLNEPDTSASAVLTSDNTQVTAGKKVTIGEIIYTFVSALTTDPAAIPYEVLIGADADTTLGNLKAAINGEAGEGTKYGTGTVAHPDVTCGAVTAHAVTVTAKVAGLAGNLIAKAEDDDHLDWDGTGGFLTGGDINDVDSIAFGESGFVNKLLVSAPSLNGIGATYVLRIKDSLGTTILESSALNENALSSVTVGFILLPTDVIEIDTSVDLTEEKTFQIFAR
jgi:hypothetical protein